MESAEIAGSPFRVVVNNRHKYRIAANLARNQQGDGGAGYRSNSGSGDLKLTGGSLVAARWLKFNTFPNDGTKPFGNSGDYGNRSHSSWLNIYNRYLNYIIGKRELVPTARVTTGLTACGSMGLPLSR